MRRLAALGSLYVSRGRCGAGGPRDLAAVLPGPPFLTLTGVGGSRRSAAFYPATFNLNSLSDLTDKDCQTTTMGRKHRRGTWSHRGVDDADSVSTASSVSTITVNKGKENPAEKPQPRQLRPWSSLKADELKKHLKGLGLPVSARRKADLVQRLERYQREHGQEIGVFVDAPEKKNGEPPSWKSSTAKAALIRLHLDDNNPIHRKSAKEVYALSPEFQLYPFARFKENLKSLRAAVKKEKEIIAEDERNYKHDIALFPRKERTSRNVPFWDTHPAKLLLESDLMDMSEGKKETLLPSELRMTRSEYQEFSISTFGDHVKQIKRGMREKTYWKAKRNREGMKKHLEEVEARTGKVHDLLWLEHDVDETAKLLEGLKLD